MVAVLVHACLHIYNNEGNCSNGVDNEVNYLAIQDPQDGTWIGEMESEELPSSW